MNTAELVPATPATWTEALAALPAPRRVPVPGGLMAVREAGRGPTGLLVHGTPSSSSEWAHLFAALAPSHRVIAPDHLGFGESDRPADPATYSLRFHAANFAAFAAVIEGPVHLVVHDFGGPIALPWAIDNAGKLASLTIVQSWAWTFLADPGFRRGMRWLDSALMEWLYRSWNFSPRFLVRAAWGRHRPLSREQHRRFIDAFPTRDSRAGAWAFARALCREHAFFDDIEARLPALAAVPTMIAWGLADGVLPTLHLERWRTALPLAQVVALPRVGHFPQVEAPELLLPPLLAHLAAHPAVNASSAGG